MLGRGSNSHAHDRHATVRDGVIRWRRGMLVVVSLFTVTALAVMAVAPIHQTAFATGSLTSVEEVVVLRNVRGGEVDRIAVQPGALVQPGDLILSFDADALSTEEARLMTRTAHLDLRAQRLRALLDEADFTPTVSGGVTEFEVAAAVELHAAEVANVASERAAFQARLAEIDANVAASEASLSSIESEIAAYAEQAGMSQRLSDRNVGTRRQVLVENARLAEAEFRRAEVIGAIHAAPLQRLGLESEMAQATAQRRADWSAQLSDAKQELADIATQLADIRRQLRQLEVRAPVMGRILEIGAATSGDVVSPGGLVARIVPADAAGEPVLLAEVRISPDDIGYIDIGSAATVDVSAFDSDLFGEIEGELVRLSPSSLIDEAGEPYFEGALHISRTQSQVGGVALRLAPGMLVQAKFATGQNTILGYLFEPVTKALDVAFTER